MKLWCRYNEQSCVASFGNARSMLFSMWKFVKLTNRANFGLTRAISLSRKLTRVSLVNPKNQSGISVNLLWPSTKTCNSVKLPKLGKSCKQLPSTSKLVKCCKWEVSAGKALRSFLWRFKWLNLRYKPGLTLCVSKILFLRRDLLRQPWNIWRNFSDGILEKV